MNDRERVIELIRLKSPHIDNKTLKNYVNILRKFFTWLGKKEYLSVDDASEYLKRQKNSGKSLSYIRIQTTVLRKYVFDSKKIPITVSKRVLHNKYAKSILTSEYVKRFFQIIYEKIKRRTNVPLQRAFVLFYLMLGTAKRRVDIIRLNSSQIKKIFAGEKIDILIVKSNVYGKLWIFKHLLPSSVENIFTLTDEYDELLNVGTVALNLFRRLVLEIPNHEENFFFAGVGENYYTSVFKKVIAEVVEENEHVIRLGIKDGRVSTVYGLGLHELRRFAAVTIKSKLMREGNSEFLADQCVQEILNHKNSNTTQRYLLSGEVQNLLTRL